jgi:hypothetical protein
MEILLIGVEGHSDQCYSRLNIRIDTNIVKMAVFVKYFTLNVVKFDYTSG